MIAEDTPPGLVWDACCALNLMALPDPAGILESFGCESYIVREVRRNEVIQLRPLPEDGLPPGSLVTVDLEPLISAQRLNEVLVTGPDETATFVALANHVDDGEARSTAVAFHRGLWLLTDDRAAIRATGTLPSPITVLTTPQWLRLWAAYANATRAEIDEAVRRMETKTRFTLKRTNPHYGWWTGMDT